MSANFLSEKSQDQNYASKGLATSNSLWDVKGDDDASNKLNAQFGFGGWKSNPWSARKSDYFFMPYSRFGNQEDLRDLKDFDIKIMDAAGTDDIMLVDRRTGQTVKETDKIVRIGTGDNYSETDLEWINKVSDFLFLYQ